MITFNHEGYYILKKSLECFQEISSIATFIVDPSEQVVIVKFNDPNCTFYGELLMNHNNFETFDFPDNEMLGYFNIKQLVVFLRSCMKHKMISITVETNQTITVCDLKSQKKKKTRSWNSKLDFDFDDDEKQQQVIFSKKIFLIPLVGIFYINSHELINIMEEVSLFGGKFQFVIEKKKPKKRQKIGGDKTVVKIVSDSDIGVVEHTCHIPPSTTTTTTEEKLLYNGNFESKEKIHYETKFFTSRYFQFIEPLLEFTKENPFEFRFPTSPATGIYSTIHHHQNFFILNIFNQHYQGPRGRVLQDPSYISPMKRICD